MNHFRINRTVSVFLALLMLFPAPAMFMQTFAVVNPRMPRQERISAHETPAVITETPSRLPEGYTYTGEVYTDDETGDYYLIKGPVSGSGCADTCWVNEAGENFSTGLTPFSEPTDLKSDPAYLPEAAPGSTAKKARGTRSAPTLPAAYDARDDRLLTPIRNQVGGTCWAHGSIAAVEADAIKNGIADAETLRLSEYHLAWYAKNGWYEGVTDSRNDGMVSSPTELILDDGGSAQMAKRALLSFAGPASRSHYGMATSEDALLEIMRQEFTYENRFDRELVVTDLFEIANERAAIKNAVLKYGAICCSYTSNSSLYTYSNPCAYYSAGRNGEPHAVAIVGWDDTFSRQYFTRSSGMPNADGAWLIRNSWGTGMHDAGYFWMSYEEPSLKEIYAYATESADAFPHVYFYDGAGVSGERTAPAAANVFTADGDEYLTKVSHGEKTNSYTFSVYGDLPEGCVDPTAGTLLYTQSGNAGGVQYIDVEGAVSLHAGERFAVVFTDLAKAYTENASTDLIRYTGNTGESFIYSSGAWQDTETLGYHNVCIRAVTKDISYADTYNVKFSCPGKYSETAYSHNGTVALPEREGYTYVLTYNGSPFDGTGVDRDITVNMHCYPTAGSFSEDDPCARKWECIYCGRQFSQPEIEHDPIAETVASGPAQPGYTKYTCLRCGDTYYENFVGYENAPGGIGENFVWQLYNGILSVDGVGDLPDMTRLSIPWANLRADVHSLYLHDGVTGIGQYVFSNCTALESIRWSEGLREIGRYAFSYAEKLARVDFPDSLRTIRSYAFYTCPALTQICFNDRISSIESNAFSRCHGLTEVTVPGSLGVCEREMYSNCRNITRVVIEEGITSLIGPPVHYNTPDIGEIAEIEEIVIPSTVSGIGENFQMNNSHSGPRRYTISPENPWYIDVDGVIFTRDMQNLVCYPARKHETYYSVPSTVAKVLPHAFYNNKYLRFLDMSGMIGTFVRDWVCLEMKSVEHINLHPRTNLLAYQALSATHMIERIFIPSSVSSIKSNSLNPAKVGTVYTDSADAPIVAFAAEKSIPCVVLEGHTHSFDTREYVEKDDCSTPGFAIDVCECGQFRYTELTPDHTPGNPVENVIRAATCSETGEKTITVKCVTCGETLSEMAAAIGLDPDNHADYGTEAVNVVAATCHSDGYTGDTVCTRCKALLEAGKVISKDTVPHAWDEGTVTLKPTCKTAGKMLYRCTAAGCGAVKEETINIASNAHVYNVTIAEPTCTEAGYTTHVCTLCNYEYTDNETGPLGHSYAIRVTPATCTDGGYTTCTCTRCHESFTKDPTPPVDHVDADGDGKCDFGCGTVMSNPDDGGGNEGDKCPFCGQTHTGPFGSLIAFFHRIAYFFKNLFRG